MNTNRPEVLEVNLYLQRIILRDEGVTAQWKLIVLEYLQNTMLLVPPDMVVIPDFKG